MKFTRLFAFVAAIATVSLAAPNAARAQGDLGIEVCSAAPGAKVATLDGKETDLANYIGKMPVVMEFWATWCPNCKELEPAKLHLQNHFRHSENLRNQSNPDRNGTNRYISTRTGALAVQELFWLG